MSDAQLPNEQGSRAVAPAVVPYASVQEPGTSTRGILALVCALTTPATWLGLYLLYLAGIEAGNMLTISAVFLGFGAAITGFCLAIFSLRYEPRKAWALVALPLCVLSFGAPCLIGVGV
jgi:hypothetical protein